ncbi:MAG: hypothetical protein JOY60_17330 [Burkholderiaceae bacterium]|nr:hypothetical protein [Burkholderiaceae bacterium]
MRRKSEVQASNLERAQPSEAQAPANMPGDEADDGPLTAWQWAVLQADASARLPQGERLCEVSLFPPRVENSADDPALRRDAERP